MSNSQFTKIIQLAFVVKNLDDAIRSYSEKYEIGPWDISEINSRTVKDLYKHDNQKDFAYKVAMCDIGDIEWELVEPLDDKSIYSDFLREKGPGLHHVAFGVRDYDGAVKSLKSKGKMVLSSGDWKGIKFVHFATEDDLDFVVELFKFPDE